eukprot:2651696-Rhodomonas_salina.1
MAFQSKYQHQTSQHKQPQLNRSQQVNAGQHLYYLATLRAGEAYPHEPGLQKPKEEWEEGKEFGRVLSLLAGRKSRLYQDVGLRCKIEDSGFRVWSSGIRVSGLRVSELRFDVWTEGRPGLGSGLCDAWC